jgi:dipeptide transport system ATP-binding protein
LLIDGVDVATNGGANNPALRRQLQMVFQNPYASLNPRKSIDATLQEPLRINTALTAAERRERVDAMLQQVGLRPEFASRYPHMFSGGQRQRVAIARAMMLNPAVVVADEPVSALDVSIQAQILNLFMDLQASFNTSYVFISHNLSVVEHVADEVLVMYLGSAVEYGSKQALFENPLHPYTRVLISATPAIRAQDRKERIRITGELPSPLHPPAGCAFSPRCPYAQSRCHTEAPALRQVEGRLVACHIVGN